MRIYLSNHYNAFVSGTAIIPLLQTLNSWREENLGRGILGSLGRSQLDQDFPILWATSHPWKLFCKSAKLLSLRKLTILNHSATQFSLHAALSEHGDVLATLPPDSLCIPPFQEQVSVLFNRGHDC